LTSARAMARLTFLGATRQVTGSCYLLETRRRRILLECGMFQGDPATTAHNRRNFPFAAGDIDAVVLSHSHLDHSGLLPKLAKAGFAGPVYVTAPTYDLLDLMLKDASYLEMKDTQWENERRDRAGKEPIEPLYTLDDVEALLALRRPVPYNDEIEIFSGIRLQFHDAGHIIGAAIVELTLLEQGRTRTLVFSGDLGNPYSPLMRDPTVLERADVLLLESTYGDRDHRSLAETLEELRLALQDAAAHGGNVLIPAFAVGRTQDLIYWLGRFHRDGQLPQPSVFLDSPMAIEASRIYARYTALFNRDDLEFNRAVQRGWEAWLPVLQYSKTTADSMALNQMQGVVIIAGSGMCEGGRIRHHLKYNLWKPETHVVITGFQPQGTLGRRLLDGATALTILGSEITVQAQIHTLGGFSAHAGQTQLLQWARGFARGNPKVYLVHGEPEAMEALKAQLSRLNMAAEIPTVGATIDL